MGRGNYHGGSTVFGPGSNWFGKEDEKHSETALPSSVDADPLKEAFRAIDEHMGAQAIKPPQSVRPDRSLDSAHPKKTKESKNVRADRLLQEKYADVTKKHFSKLP
jgi:hypothetical protein